MAEENLTLAEDLGTIKSIDFVNRFEAKITELLQLLNISNITKLPADLKIQTYKWTKNIANKTVAEGETIPLSKVSRSKDKEYQVSWQKLRRAVTVEAIARHGKAVAIDKADQKVLRSLQNDFKTSFIDLMQTAPVAADDQTTLQGAIAQAYGKLQTIEEFEGAEFVALVNPLDVADYLSDAKVQPSATGIAGIQLIQNFLGADNVIVMNAVPKGNVLATAVDNLNFAYLDLSSPDFADLVDFTDETGIVSVKHDAVTTNATLDALYMSAIVLFPELVNGVVLGKIVPAAQEPAPAAQG